MLHSRSQPAENICGVSVYRQAQAKKKENNKDMKYENKQSFLAQMVEQQNIFQ
jgi:hypothetical protein